MHEPTVFQINLLRALYLLVAVGLGWVVMPGFFQSERIWGLHEGVVQCMLAAFWACSVLGVRYPLQMLPVLIWEIIWKGAWLIWVAVPLWMQGKMDEPTWAVATAVLGVLIMPIFIPWKYLYQNYLQKSGDAWR